MYIGNGLAQLVVENLLEEPHLGMVRSPGTDMVTVCRHALAARRRQLTRNVVVSIARGATLVGAVLGAVVYHNVPVLAGMVLMFFLIPWIVLFVEAYRSRWGALAQSLRPERFPTATPPPVSDPREQGELDRVAAYATGNVTVHRGYDPFAGHGVTRGGWSIALDTAKPKDSKQPIESFTVIELNARLRSEIAALDVDNLTAHNRVFVDGEDVHHDRRFLPDINQAPVARVDRTMIEHLMTDPEDCARPYLVVEIVSWDGEMVWTAFVRLVLSTTSLFVETNYCVLPPLDVSYRALDDLLSRPTTAQISRLLVSSLMRALPFGRLSGLGGLFAGMRRDSKYRHQDRQIHELFHFNHGALLDIRKNASTSYADGKLSYRRHFQYLDEQRLHKTVDRRIFKSLIAFLSEKNIDPDELIRRSEHIVNNSVAIGGNVTMVNSALAGADATASTTAEE